MSFIFAFPHGGAKRGCPGDTQAGDRKAVDEVPLMNIDFIILSLYYIMKENYL